MTDRIINSCQSSARYIYKANASKPVRIEIAVCLLVPEGDPLYDHYAPHHGQEGFYIFQGSLDDVLSRYIRAMKELEADYICRITGDCPIIPDTVISKHILTACTFKLDYLSNVHEEFRTFADGLDCEVISKRLMEYADTNAKDKSDREHVTTYIRKYMPVWASKGHLTDKELDKSSHKFSVDTEEEYKEVKRLRESKEYKDRLAQRAGFRLFNF